MKTVKIIIQDFDYTSGVDSIRELLDELTAEIVNNRRGGLRITVTIKDVDA